MSILSASDEYAFLDAYETKALARNSKENPYWFVNKNVEKSPALPLIMQANFEKNGDFQLPPLENLQAYQALMKEIERRKPFVEPKPPPAVVYTPFFLQEYQFRGMPYSEIEQEPQGYFGQWRTDFDILSPLKRKLFTDYDLRKRAWEYVKEKPEFREHAPQQGNDFHGIHFNDAEYASLCAAYNSRRTAYFRDFYARKEAFLHRTDVQAAMANTPPAFKAYVYGDV